MKDSAKLWQTYQSCKAYRCRPSELLDITEQPTAYFLDRAVQAFGTALETELEKAGQGKKSKGQVAMAQRMILNRWLRTPGQFAEPTKKR